MYNFFRKTKKLTNIRSAENIFSGVNNPYSIKTNERIDQCMIGSVNFFTSEKNYMCDILMLKEDYTNYHDIQVDKISINSYTNIILENEDSILTEGYLRSVSVPDEIFFSFINALKEIEFLRLLGTKPSKVIHFSSKLPILESAFERKVSEMQQKILNLFVKYDFPKAIKKDLTAQRKGKSTQYLDDNFSQMLYKYLEENNIRDEVFTTTPILYLKIYFENILLDSIKSNKL